MNRTLISLFEDDQVSHESATPLDQAYELLSFIYYHSQIDHVDIDRNRIDMIPQVLDIIKKEIQMGPTYYDDITLH